jgi:sugar lactone lactonase YvrE
MHHHGSRSARGVAHLLCALALSSAMATAGCGDGSDPSTGPGSTGGSDTGFLDKYPLDAKFPEGGAYDSAAHAFYVGSLGDGSIHRINAATGAEEVLFTESAPGKWWTLGMAVDVERRRLWVCAMDDRSPDPRAGYIWVFDLESGERVANHALADAAPDATCTDVALTKAGVGYVGDREVGNMYKVDPSGGASMFASSPDLEANFVGQNAMVVLPDESALLTVLYLPSSLARVDLADGSVTKVDIQGPFEDTSALAGADGMTFMDGSAYVAFTSKLVKVTPQSMEWSAATSKEAALPSGMTDVIPTPEGLYLLNGQSVVFAFGSVPEPFQLVRFTGEL